MPLFRNTLLVMVRTPNTIISRRCDQQQTNDGSKYERADKIPKKPKGLMYTQYCDQQAENHVYEKEYHRTYAPLGRPKRQSVNERLPFAVHGLPFTVRRAPNNGTSYPFRVLRFLRAMPFSCFPMADRSG